MPVTRTQAGYFNRSITPDHVPINPSIMEGEHLYPSILGPDAAEPLYRAAPVWIQNPILTGTLKIPNLLSVSEGVTTGSPRPNFSYRWRINSQTIPGETGNTLLTDVTMDADTIDCEVTATNTEGSVGAYSNQLVPIDINPVDLEEFTTFAITGIVSDTQLFYREQSTYAISRYGVDGRAGLYGYDVYAITAS